MLRCIIVCHHQTAQEPGRQLCLIHYFLKLRQTMENMAIILFVQEKKLRKKSLFLVMNMAFADVMLGAEALPLYVYLIVGPDYHLWTAEAAHKSIFYFLDTTFSQSSLISAGFISCERFYAVFWPLKHKTLSTRAYGIVIFLRSGLSLSLFQLSFSFPSTLRVK